MQRQLLLIADKLPDDITLTLLKSFAKILSREPEPTPKTPFIRAFAKIRDDGIDKQFVAIAEEDDEQLKIYESGSGDESGDNECTFNYKVTTATEQIVYNVSNNDESDALVEENADQDQVAESDENTAENVDEGIEVEMPKLLLADDSAEAEAEFAAIADQETSNVDGENVVEDQDHSETEKFVDEEPAEALVEEVEEVVEIEEEPIPAEPPKVTLDDIQREIQEMQMFLLHKGISPEKKKKTATAAVVEENSNGNTSNKVNIEGDSKNVDDAYQVDVCIKLKNRNEDPEIPEKHERRHQHSKYMRSENYKEEIVDEGPIFDPTIPNTEEDFMKIKSVEERFHRKNQKVQTLDNSWQNLCENQKKLYK